MPKGSVDSRRYPTDDPGDRLVARGLRAVGRKGRGLTGGPRVLRHGVSMLALLLMLGLGPASVMGLPAALAQAGQGPAAESPTGTAAAWPVAANPVERPGDGQESVGPAFLVAGFRFSGNTAFSQEELSGLLAGYAGRELTLAQLEEAAAAITRFYREQGYFLASAHVPPQEVVDGIVELAVVEGRWGEVTLENGAGLREAVARRLLGPVRPGALIQEGLLDRAIRLLNETPGVQARATVRAGAQPGTSDLTVILAPEKRAGVSSNAQRSRAVLRPAGFPRGGADVCRRRSRQPGLPARGRGNDITGRPVGVPAAGPGAGDFPGRERAAVHISPSASHRSAR